MTEVDLDEGVRLCRLAGWNQLRSDWEGFLAGNPQGCFVAEDAGNVVGTVTTTNYENKVGWIAMVLVEPSMRGRSIGANLVDTAIDALSGCACIKLDATPSGRKLYATLGFQDEYPLSRMTAQLSPDRAPAADSTSPMNEGDLGAVLALDEEAFGVPRPQVIEHFFNEAPEFARVARDDSGRLFGFVLGRHGYHFDQVGPVVAQDFQTAPSLAQSALAKASGKAVALDISCHSKPWTSWLERLGFTEQRPFMRMFRGKNTDPGRPATVFAISGPEQG